MRTVAIRTAPGQGQRPGIQGKSKGGGNFRPKSAYTIPRAGRRGWEFVCKMKLFDSPGSGWQNCSGSVRTINEYIRNIFAEGELVPESVVRKFRITADAGKILILIDSVVFKRC